MKTRSDQTPPPQLRRLNKLVVQIIGLLVKKNITYFEKHYFHLCFLLHVPILLL